MPRPPSRPGSPWPRPPARALELEQHRRRPGRVVGHRPAEQPTAAPSASSSTAAATIGLQSVSGIPGKFLVDGQGRSLYLFEADKSATSTCTGACAAAWPPVTASGMPMAGSGVSQSLLGTTKRADGTEQLTYNGHPLYYFAADTGAGMAKGQGSKEFGAGWYVVNAQGSKIDND